MSTFDYFADDEDSSQPKGPLNAFLSKPYYLEFASIGAIATFFFLNSVLLSDKQ